MRLARELVSTLRVLNRAIAPRPGTRTTDGSACAGAARAARLRRHHRRQAAGRDRPDRPLQDRRATRPARRRRTARSKLRPQSPPPTRPRRQPATERRPLPDRDHAGPLLHARPRLGRPQTRRGQESARSTPLPQTPARPHRLQHPENEPRLDIGARLAQARHPSLQLRRLTSPDARLGPRRVPAPTRSARLNGGAASAPSPPTRPRAGRGAAPPRSAAARRRRPRAAVPTGPARIRRAMPRRR